MRIPVASLALAVGAATGLWAQTAERRLAWEPVGAWTVDLNLAGPAGGAVAETAFSADGTQLFAVTARGEVWVTTDLGETWARSEASPRAAEPLPLAGPELQAAIYRHPFESRVFFALGRHLYRSGQDGRSWVNLTADGAGSVIGEDQRSIAFSPLDPGLIVVANARGLWRSVDGGLSWSGLNRYLPNLPRTKILDAQRVFLDQVGVAEAIPVRQDRGWRPLSSGATTLPDGDRRRSSPWPLPTPAGWSVSYRIWRGGEPVSPDLTDCASGPCAEPDQHYIRAFAWGGDAQPVYYAGTTDGRLWISSDGVRWRLAAQGFASNGSPVTGIFVDRRDPRVAVVAVGGRGHGHVFRTTNAGIFWDDLSANLPDAPVEAIAANPETGSIYIASEAGVFYTRGDLRNPGPATRWSRLGGNLPAGAVEDLALDQVAGRLYAAVAGYGLYRTTVPDIADALRVLNAADLTARAAAPGGLLTVIGSPVREARAAGRSAPVLAANQTESQIQVPFEASGPQLDLELDTQKGAARLALPLEEVSPAVFIDRDGVPLALDASSGVLLDSSRPARAGSQILVLTTGLGRVRPDWPTGLAAPLENPPATIAPVSAFLDGAPLKVISATLAGGYIGVYMVRLELPAVLNSGTAELWVSAADKSSNKVRIFLEP